MTYDLLIFTNNPKAYAPTRIKEELEKINLTCAIVTYGEAVPDSKRIFFRDFGESGKYADLIQKLNSPKVINFESFKKWPTLDKIKQYKEFKKAGIPAIETSLTPRSTFPFIAKLSASSQGRGVEKITSKKSLNEFLKIHTGENILFQPFLTAGEDLRIIVLGDKVLGAMKRTAIKGEYLTNYSRGGKVENFEVKKDLKELAEKTAKCFKLDYCGVDLMKGNDGEWKVLEVNRACQFKGFEFSTGINVARQLVDYLD